MLSVKLQQSKNTIISFSFSEPAINEKFHEKCDEYLNKVMQTILVKLREIIPVILKEIITVMYQF